MKDNISEIMTELLPELPKIEKEDKGLYGWVCPKCGAVMSPYTSYCINCSKQNFEPTWSVGDHLSANVDIESKKESMLTTYLFYNRKDKLGYE